MSTVQDVATTVSAVFNQTSQPKPRYVDYYIWVYVSPVVFLVGFVGNLLSIAVLQGRGFKRTTTAIYLPLIAVADTLVLLSGLVTDWLEWAVSKNIKESDVWMCRLHKVVFYTAGDISIWLIVMFTFDRFVAVCFPLSKRRVCTTRRATLVSMLIVLLSLVKNVHEFWTRGPQYDTNNNLVRVCGYEGNFAYFHIYIRPWIAFTFITAIPFLLILVFNCMIVRSLIRAQRMRALTAANSSSTGTGNTSPKGFKQTTLMCLSVSFAFLVCIAPSIVLLICKPYWAPSVAYSQAKAVNNLFVYINHSINFVLYCVSGQRFRDELSLLFRKVWSRCQHQSVTVTETDAGAATIDTPITITNGLPTT